MVFQPAPDVCSVTFHYDSTDVFWSNVLHFAQPGFDTDGMNDLITDLATTFIPALMDILPEAVECSGVTLYDLRAADAPRIIYPFTPPVIGGDELAEVVSLKAAAVLTFYTSGRGKWNQGRAYIGGIAEELSDERRVQDGTMTALRDAFQTLIDTPPVGWSWVVLSRQLNGAARPLAVYAPILTVVARSGIWGSQSRRVKRP